ncbi:MAG: tail fiber domain-containing protein, partial [Bacteroidota bacterium]
YRSGYNTTTPDGNTALGHSSLFSNLTGFWNTAIGTYTLYSNTTGIQNTASGFLALHNNTMGSHNTANGYFALFHNSTGSQNTALGYNSGPINGGFSNTTALGAGVMPTASNQVRIGNGNVLSIGGYAGWSNLSDGRFKKDIKEDIPGLDFITKLRPVSYALDRAKLHTFLGKDSEKVAVSENIAPQTYPREVGFVAQEVEQLLHENRYPYRYRNPAERKRSLQHPLCRVRGPFGKSDTGTTTGNRSIKKSG